MSVEGAVLEVDAIVGGEEEWCGAADSVRERFVVEFEAVGAARVGARVRGAGAGDGADAGAVGGGCDAAAGGAAASTSSRGGIGIQGRISATGSSK